MITVDYMFTENAIWSASGSVVLPLYFLKSEVYNICQILVVIICLVVENLNSVYSIP